MNCDLKYIDELRSRLLGGGSDEARLPGGGEDGETVIFGIDISGSMFFRDYPPNRFLAGVDSAEVFLRARLETRANDIVGAVVFDTGYTTVERGVPIAEAFVKVIAPLRLTGAGGGTDIGAGLSGIHRCLKSAVGNRTRRVLLLTDGGGGEPEPVAERMKSDGIIIDVIGIGGSRSDVNEESLMRVASVVDGEVRYRFIGDRMDLMSHFRKIATDLTFRR